MISQHPRKTHHEVRDPIHVFIRLSTDERGVLDSRPVQRLRHIRQLAMTYLVYPGATHQRFEHSLGTMELADRVYRVITDPRNVKHDLVTSITEDPQKLETWRATLRMAALCHDVGHLPFSHGAEQDLLPEGVTHERLTLALIRSDEMVKHWNRLKIQTEDVAKLSVGPRYYTLPDGASYQWEDWEAVLAEVIVGDAFGADRIDYLLRDSHHAGVAYGRFDHYRLIDTIRVLPKEGEGSQEPMLGIEEGGIHTAESLLLARYFMYTQVYHHPVRRIYDIHLKEFLREWLPGRRFGVDPEEHLRTTDDEVSAAIRESAHSDADDLATAAKRIARREHFRKIYERNEEDLKRNKQAPQLICTAVKRKFGDENVREDSYREEWKEGHDPRVFPVLMDDGRVQGSLSISTVLNMLPRVLTNFVYVHPNYKDVVIRWIDKNRNAILVDEPGGADHD